MQKMFLLTLLVLVCSMMFAQSNEITDDTIIYMADREMTVGQLQSEMMAYQAEARQTLGAYTTSNGTLFIPMPENERLALQQQKELSEQQIMNQALQTQLSSTTRGTYETSYSNTWGDASKLAVNLDVGAQISGADQQRAFKAHAYAGGSLFGSSVTMARFEVGADQTGNQLGQASGKAWGTLSVFGMTIWSPSYQSSQGIELVGLDAPIVKSFSAKYPFVVGPVPMSVKFTLSIMAGINLQLSVIPGELAIKGSVTPYFNTELATDVAVDCVVVSAGARCDLTFFDDQLPIVGKASYTPSTKTVQLSLTVDNVLHVLDGSLSLFAQALGCDIAELELFAWEGFAKTWRLYEKSVSYKL